MSESRKVYRVTVGDRNNNMRQTSATVTLTESEARTFARVGRALDASGGEYGETLTIEHEVTEMQPVKVWRRVGE